jgi:DOPA 4,5-dioxygenase
MTLIKNFHAHVYFEPEQFEQAKALCEQAHSLFDVKIGRFHHKPVGPHPMHMCQLTVNTARIGEFIPWLALNRNGLVMFIHPDTGDDLKDHTEHAIWMGKMMTLDLSIFE